MIDNTTQFNKLKPASTLTENTILLVDDEPGVLASIQRLLHREGYVVLIASSGKAGLELLKNNSVNVVLSDLRMPIMSGVAFLKLVKERYPTAIRILISAYEDIPGMRDAINCSGVYKILSKPWDNTDLLSTIGAAFHTYRLQRENQLLTEQLVSINHKLNSKNDELNQALLQAKEVTKSKSEFLSNMSHDMRTPMNAVLGFAQLINMDESLAQEHKDNANEILTAGQYLLELINEILKLSHIESEKIKLDFKSTTVYEVINESVSLVRPLLNSKNISINWNYENDSQWLVEIDKFRLKEILINLLSNAIKYNKENGEITINCEVCHGRLRINIIDTGKGLSPDQLIKIFEPFNRVGAEKTKIEGSGIGLTITKKLVQLMGGEMGVRSKLHIGSCFFIEFKLITKE